MNIKSLIYLFMAFVFPWILLALAIALKVYNPWIYVGSITWFATAMFLFLSFYRTS